MITSTFNDADANLSNGTIVTDENFRSIGS